MKKLFVFLSIFTLSSLSNQTPGQTGQELSSRLEVVSHRSKVAVDRKYPSTVRDEFGSTHDPSVEPDKVIGIFEVTVKNLSSTLVKAVWWQYVFHKGNTDYYISTCSRGRINPWQTKRLKTKHQNAPTPASQVTNERVIIQRLEYQDGEIWEAPSS